ncbi:MAG: transketolase [Oscillospiraceae bacterium]|nr:transketolase [Oscillospiraceae bacterium]
MEENNIHELQLTAARARLLAMEMVYTAASGHIGGSLSAMDILTALYFDRLRVNPSAPKDPARDRFVLSKGHCTPALYAVLALRGYFDCAELRLFRSIDGHYSGHPDMTYVPGVDMSTGSLGQGISAAVGMALAGKLDKAAYRVYTLLGDGETQEGQVWEAAMSAHKYHLDNLCVIVDVNGLQIDGRTADVMPTEPLDARFSAFGFYTITADGHDFSALRSALDSAQKVTGQPVAILAHTVKGKGVSFMENDAGWHGKAPNAEQYAVARAELEATLAALEGK